MTKCFYFWHDYIFKGSKLVDHTWAGEHMYTTTELLYECKRCEKFRVKEIKGSWKLTPSKKLEIISEEGKE